MYKAKDSFTTKSYDVKRGQILEDDFTNQDEITDFLNIGYIEEFDGQLDITANGTYDVTDYEQAVVNVSGGGSDVNWSAIGYNSTPQSIVDAYNYSKNIYDNWIPAESLRDKFNGDAIISYMPLVDTSMATTMRDMFRLCTNLEIVPKLNTSNVTSMTNMFYNCTHLKEIPAFDCEKVVAFNTTFGQCPNLTDNSLNNILKMCISATSYTGTKTLSTLGFIVSNYPVSRIEALPSYQAFIDAGWTIGY